MQAVHVAVDARRDLALARAIEVAAPSVLPLACLQRGTARLKSCRSRIQLGGFNLKP